MAKKLKIVKVVTDTTDYDEIQMLGGGYNRELNPAGIKALKEALLEYGFIGYAIAIVTGAFGGGKRTFIADGQHRIEVARMLGIPFSYQVVKLKNDTQFEVCKLIATLNSNATNWSPEKYLDSFSALGIKEYVTMKKTKKETGLTVTDLQNVFLFGSGANEVKAFKSGVMTFPDLRGSKEMLEALMAVKDVLPNKAYTRRSLFKIFKQTLGEYKRFVEAVKFVIKRSKKEVPENEKMLFDFLKDVFEAEFSEEVKK